MTPDPHADLRAMLEALPSLDISVHDGVTATVGSWLLRAPALVRALLEERNKLVEQLAARPRADVYVTAASHNEAMRALEQERDAILAENKRLRETNNCLKAEVERIRVYVESKHNSYGETGKALGMARPASLLDAIKELVEENETLASMEARDLRREVEKLRAAKSAEDAKAPSVIRDGFPSDSLMEEAARLGRELASSLDDLLKEARRRKESKP